MIFSVRVPGDKGWFGSQPTQTVPVKGDYFSVGTDGTLAVYSRHQCFREEVRAVPGSGAIMSGRLSWKGDDGLRYYSLHVPVSGQFDVTKRASFVPGAWLSVRQEGW